ncbi:hypothetical protein ALC60_09245 [Trachymyrmex zeteki]|uniref:Laminin subunit alpha-2 n=1 Tax=Mycetomoellerius zeteki TaxID=64791 RepID=A0A151WV72_9HYME|nr:hypothetical protein ALC60_09245 [Trachymyrmex zeteki]
MVRVALLATVLAALCYTSQAIPAQVGSTEFELRKEISDQIQQILDNIPEEVKDKIEDYRDKFLEYLEQFEKYSQEKGRSALNIFERAKENAMKWLQENKNVNEVLEKLKKVKQEIETNYQYALNNQIQNIKDTIGQNILEKGKDIINGAQNKLTESSKKIVNDADETIKKFKEYINESLQKGDKIKELINNLDKSWDILKETIKNVTGRVKDDKVKRSVSNVITDRQQASIIGGLLDTANSLVKETKKGIRIIGGNEIDDIKNNLGNLKDLMGEILGAEKGTQEETTEKNIKDDTKNI